MFTLFIILASIASVLLILIVLIQNPKGGGIAANFSAANQIAGVKKTNDLVEKATWTFAIVIMICSLGARFFLSSDAETGPQSTLIEAIDNGDVATPAPSLPTNPEGVPTPGENPPASNEAPAPEQGGDDSEDGTL